LAQDRPAAAKWYTLAAEQGVAVAAYFLSMAYFQGHGVKQDDVEAAKWTKQAAEQGHREAQFNLGKMYCQGQGVLEDYVEAVKWCTRAAEQGHAKAQCQLGAMYGQGDKSLPQSDRLAAKWIKLAALQGDADAIEGLRGVLDLVLFPAGTRVKLVGLAAAMLNGLCGEVVVRGAGEHSPAGSTTLRKGIDELVQEKHEKSGHRLLLATRAGGAEDAGVRGAGGGGGNGGGGGAPLGIGLIAVLLDNGREQAFPFENLVGLPADTVWQDRERRENETAATLAALAAVDGAAGAAVSAAAAVGAAPPTPRRHVIGSHVFANPTNVAAGTTTAAPMTSSAAATAATTSAAEEKRRKKKEKAARQKAKKEATAVAASADGCSASADGESPASGCT
jgi:hypothetical protein